MTARAAHGARVPRAPRFTPAELEAQLQLGGGAAARRRGHRRRRWSGCGPSTGPTATPGAASRPRSAASATACGDHPRRRGAPLPAAAPLRGDGAAAHGARLRAERLRALLEEEQGTPGEPGREADAGPPQAASLPRGRAGRRRAAPSPAAGALTRWRAGPGAGAARRGVPERGLPGGGLARLVGRARRDRGAGRRAGAAAGGGADHRRVDRLRGERPGAADRAGPRGAAGPGRAAGLRPGGGHPLGHAPALPRPRPRLRPGGGPRAAGRERHRAALRFVVDEGPRVRDRPGAGDRQPAHPRRMVAPRVSREGGGALRPGGGGHAARRRCSAWASSARWRCGSRPGRPRGGQGPDGGAHGAPLALPGPGAGFSIANGPRASVE